MRLGLSCTHGNSLRQVMCRTCDSESPRKRAACSAFSRRYSSSIFAWPPVAINTERSVPSSVGSSPRIRVRRFISVDIRARRRFKFGLRTTLAVRHNNRAHDFRATIPKRSHRLTLFGHFHQYSMGRALLARSVLSSGTALRLRCVGHHPRKHPRLLHQLEASQEIARGLPRSRSAVACGRLRQCSPIRASAADPQ